MSFLYVPHEVLPRHYFSFVWSWRAGGLHFTDHYLNGAGTRTYSGPICELSLILSLVELNYFACRIYSKRTPGTSTDPGPLNLNLTSPRSYFTSWNVPVYVPAHFALWRYYFRIEFGQGRPSKANLIWRFIFLKLYILFNIRWCFSIAWYKLFRARFFSESINIFIWPAPENLYQSYSIFVSIYWCYPIFNYWIFINIQYIN